MNPTKQIVGAGDIVIDRLGEGYLVTPYDCIWLNYVHLLCMYLIEKQQGESYQFYVRTAIEWITIDKGFIHHDPYELWIDAGFFDSELNEIGNDLDAKLMLGK